jgi:HAD domain in Swiss Army Knife RNA repair proteins
MNVIFLDIDGVMQPYATMQQGNQQDAIALRKKLANYVNPEIAALPIHTVRAVYQDWSQSSIENLRKLLINFNAKIVISSSWRECETIQTIRTIFSIHGLDSYILDVTPILTHRVTEVAAYLAQHTEIQRFVIFDDDKFYRFEEYFPDNFVWCNDEIGEEEFQRAKAILSKE